MHEETKINKLWIPFCMQKKPPHKVAQKINSNISKIITTKIKCQSGKLHNVISGTYFLEQ